MLLQINIDNIEDLMDRKDISVIHFVEPNCNVSKNNREIIDKVKDEYKDIVFSELDTEKEEELAENFNVKNKSGVLIFFKNGDIIEILFGALNEKRLKDKIDSLL